MRSLPASSRARATLTLVACWTVSLAGCARAVGSATTAVAPIAARQFPFTVDSQHSERLRPGVIRRSLYASTGPWVVQVLDVRLDQCHTAVAVKGGASAVGRHKTSTLLADLARTREVIGGVNADFFLFTPPGVPTGLHMTDGRVLTPPSERPTFAIDSAGRPHIGFFTVAAAQRQAFTVDDPALPALSLLPFHPREAVGGRPILTRDSVILGIVDTEGQAAFAQTRHPRTALGIADRGRRLLLVVIDGRQKGYSDGMTLRETATLMLALGAPDAINLDGGGSSALVYAVPDSAGVMRVANRPSDPTGERAVGNALAVIRDCRRSAP